MTMDDFLEGARLPQIAHELQPILLNSFITEIMDDVFGVVGHLLIERVGLPETFERDFASGLK